MIGRELLRLLSQADVSTRALTRNPQRLRSCPTSRGWLETWANQKRWGPCSRALRSYFCSPAITKTW
jgi:hypothetical protein